MNKKIFCLFIAVLVSLIAVPCAFAEEDGGEILYKDTGKRAPVPFSHKAHLDAGNKCGDCHDGIFQKKKGSADADNAMTMKSLKAGKFCGVCHDGEKAFTARRNCGKCHIKSK